MRPKELGSDWVHRSAKGDVLVFDRLPLAEQAVEDLVGDVLRRLEAEVSAGHVGGAVPGRRREDPSNLNRRLLAGDVVARSQRRVVAVLRGLRLNRVEV